ncbi:O-antigen ligase family protein [Fusobacterium ulcerans]|uniref:O-antigen ligase family protein n=2 Tax=Fusobacterium ulcerans TaxID=861 RepID=UPI0011C16C3C|nr:O-antigen ligase family protein [Fusobacterium ulcerans]
MFKELKVDVILNRILNIIIILYPFFLIRRSGTDSLTNLILITTFICCLKNKKINLKMENKKIYVLFIISLFFILSSLIGNCLGENTVKHLNEYFFNLLLLFSILQIKLESEIVFKIEKVFYCSLFLPIVVISVILIETKFKFVRVSGFWNISTYSFMIGLSTVISLYLLIYYKKYRYLILMPFLYGMVLFSGTRMIWLITFLLTFFILLISKNKKIYIGLLLGIMTLLVVFYKTDNNNPIKYRIKTIAHTKSEHSSGTRIYMYKEALEQFKLKPINGNGFVTYGILAQKRHTEELQDETIKDYRKKKEAYGNWRYHSHNNFFELLCGTGILGTVSFYIANLYLLYLLIKNRIKNNKKIMCDIGILTFLFYHMYGISDVTLYMGRVTEIYFFIVGVIINLIITAEETKNIRI